MFVVNTINTATINTAANQFTSESTREFGEVLSEFKSSNWQTGISQLLPTGTTLDLSWQTTKTRFKYELRESGFVVESEEPLFENRMVATITQNIHDNGVGSAITFDIGMAVVELKLRAIRKLPEPSC